MNEQSVFSFSESNSTDQKSLKIKWNSVQNPATARDVRRALNDDWYRKTVINTVLVMT